MGGRPGGHEGDADKGRVQQQGEAHRGEGPREAATTGSRGHSH